MSDLISRDDLIEKICNAEAEFKADHMESIASDDGDPFVDGVLSGVFNIRQMVIQAPPVNPQCTEAEIQKIQEMEQAEIQKAYELGKAEQSKTGHWIRFKEFENGYYHIKCSECGQYWSVDGHAKIFRYCFNCGAKMEEVDF